MDAFCHEAVDCSHALVGEHVHLFVHHIHVVAHHRTGLCVFRLHGLHFVSSFGNQWQKQLEIKVFRFQNLLRQAVAVVGEIVGKHRSQVQAFALV